MNLLDIGGEDVLAVFREASYEITIEEIDASAAKDGWMQREICRRDWTFNCTKLVETAGQVFATLILAGGSCIVSTDIGGSIFLGTGIISSANVATGNPQTETLRVVAGGGTPTIT